MTDLHLNTSYQYHLVVAAIISLWLVLFLVLIAPFDVGELPFRIRIEIMPFYGVISFISYMVLVPIQNWKIKLTKRWTLFDEISFVLIFSLIAQIGSFLYYSSDIVRGKLGYWEFTLEIYFPIFLILLSILVFVRWLLIKNKPSLSSSETVLIKGDNKRDVLQINFSDLVCITSADNYIEVNYLKEGLLHKKLLRNTLKNIQDDFPSLIKVHRSCLINPAHLIEWKSAKALVLTQMEVPTTKTYKEGILAISQSSQNSADSSLRP